MVLSVIYVAYLMWCFNRDLPEGLKDAPVIGRYGKLLDGFTVGIAVWYVGQESGAAMKMVLGSS